MSLLCDITRCASSTITRHIQICSRMAMMQHGLLCVAYSGTPYWNIRFKSNVSSGKGKRKDKAHNTRVNSYPSTMGTEAPPYYFDLFGGNSKIVNLCIDILSKLNKNHKTMNVLFRSLMDDGKQYRARNKLEMSQRDRGARSSEGKKSTQRASSTNVGRETEKSSAKSFGEFSDMAQASLKAKTDFPKTVVSHNEFQVFAKNCSKPGYSPSEIKDTRRELKRNAPTIGPETFHDLKSTTGKVNEATSKKDYIQEIKPTFVEIIKNPKKTDTDLLVEKSALGFKSGGAVVRGSNFIVVDHRLCFAPRYEAQQSGHKTREVDLKNTNISMSNESMFSAATGKRPSRELQQQGAVIRGSNFIIVNSKSSTVAGRAGPGSNGMFTPDISSGPIITNSTDSVANGKKHAFVLVDAVEHNIAKRYGREKGNFVLNNDNPHTITKSKDAAKTFKNDMKQGPKQTVVSAKLDSVCIEGDTKFKKMKNAGDKKKHNAIVNAPGINNANTLANEITNKRGSQIEDNAPLTSFDSVIKDSQKLIEQIQKDAQNKTTFIGPLSENQHIAKAAGNKQPNTTNNTTKTKTKLADDSKVIQTKVPDIPNPSTLAPDASKLPKVSVKELKPNNRGTKATENDSTPGTHKKKEDGEPSLYVKPEELGKKMSPPSKDLGQEKKSNSQQNKSCNEPGKKSKPAADKTTSVADFDNWSEMLRQRMLNYQSLTSRESVGPNNIASTEVAVKKPRASQSFTTQIVSPSVVSRCPLSSSLNAAQEIIHTKTWNNESAVMFDPNNSKNLNELKKDIQANFSGVFKGKFSDKPKVKAYDNAITNNSNHVTRDQTMLSNAKLDIDRVVNIPNQELKDSATAKNPIGDTTTARSSSGAAIKIKIKIRLRDRYVLIPASEWAKVRESIFAEELPKSKEQTIKITPTGDKKCTPPRTAESDSCQNKAAPKSSKSNGVLALKPSESPIVAAKGSRQISTASMKRNTVSGDNEKGVSNKFDGTTSSLQGSLVVNELPSKRYAAEREAVRSKSETNAGSAKKLKIDAPGCGQVVATKSASSLPQGLGAELEVKPVPISRSCTADATSKLEKAKANADSTPTKVNYFDTADVLQEFQRSAQLQKQMIECCERDLIKYKFALNKYKAMLSMAKKSALKK